jgi:3-hydroxymyristoyl/3-hydroxydecanoyl-(acyl carrier protein) dehydratase
VAAGAVVAGPRVLETARSETGCEQVLQVPGDLAYLAGHFPDFPVVPGIVQLGWILEAARQLLGAPVTVRRIEVLKFKALLRPADVFRLRVEHSPARSALEFRLWNDAQVFASGRLLVHAERRR